MARTDKSKNKPLDKKKKIKTDQPNEDMSASPEPSGPVIRDTSARSTPRSTRGSKKRQEPQRIEPLTFAGLPQSEKSESAEKPKRVSSFTDISSTTNGNQGQGMEDDSATHRRIAERAFILFVESGCEHGNDWLHWFEAERQVKETRT